MTDLANTANSQSERDLSVATYYGDLTDSMLVLARDARMFHYGVWGADVRSEPESMVHSVHTLVDGCNLEPGMHVLDSGCGLGGTAVTLAQQYGVNVSGVTICESHVPLAQQWAEEQEVGDLVKFYHGDFMELPFPDATFDVVVNQESFCYATDRLAYLRGVSRVLKPGGRWQMLDFILANRSMSASEKALHLSLQRSYHMPPLTTIPQLLATLTEAGFQQTSERNITAQIMPCAEAHRNRLKLFVLMAPPLQPRAANLRELIQGIFDGEKGFREEVFTYNFVSATHGG